MQEALVDRLMETFSGAWLRSVEPVSDARLIFICGMFRSGSTLLEQMLAAHPDITAGGEIAFFAEQAPLPGVLTGLTETRVRALGEGYLEYLERTFPRNARVTNKRPDNFLYMGLIRRMFPNARFLNTRRHPLDNCISIYFQEIRTHFKYSNELLDIGHFYVQHRRLMARWRELFPANIIDVAYDDLVREPERVLRSALAFLELEWDPACLRFYELDNRVRTASVWQVRQPLHSASSGRWVNYEQQLEGLRQYLTASGELT